MHLWVTEGDGGGANLPIEIVIGGITLVERVVVSVLVQRDGVADDPFERRRAEQPCHELVERRVRVTILVELACGERGGGAVVSTRASSRVGVARPRGDETVHVVTKPSTW